MTNTIKHADATSAHVRLTYQDGEVGLEVTDDGRPGGIAAVPRGPGPVVAGHGLAGMGERAAVFGGDVSAGARPEGGWPLHARLHISAAQAGGQGAGTEET